MGLQDWKCSRKVVLAIEMALASRAVVHKSALAAVKFLGGTVRAAAAVAVVVPLVF